MARFVLKMLVLLGLAMIVAGGAANASAPRLALVLGNSEYEFGRLKNPTNDAALIAESLRGVGFEVFEYLDADQRAMKRAIVGFGRALGDAGENAVGLVYYAGHGVQYGGENYMIPVGAQIEDEIDVDIEGIRASTLLAALDRAGNRLNIVILDACRNNPFAASSRSAAQGLARMDAPSGTLLAYSTSPGNVAVDGAGRNSPYTQALARAIREPGTKVEDVFKRVRIAVMERTNDKQVPWESSSLTGDFYFTDVTPEKSAAQSISQPALGTDPADQTAEIEFWRSIANSDNPDMFRGYLTQFPDGLFASIASERIASIEEDQAARAISRQRDIEQRLWDEVKDSNDPTMLESFMAQYPNSIFRGLAEARIASLTAAATPAPQVQSNNHVELLFWESIKDSKAKADLQAYLSRYPNGQFASIAQNRLNQMAQPSQVAVAPATRPAGPIKWQGPIDIQGRAGWGVNWCQTGQEPTLILHIENGLIDGVIETASIGTIKVDGAVTGQRLRGKAYVARGFTVTGTIEGDVIRGKIWAPTSGVCSGRFELSRVRAQ